MIRVCHNDSELLLDPAHYASIGEVVEACLGADGRRALLQRISVDGLSVSERDLELLLSRPLTGVGEIEIESRSPRAVAIVSLRSCREYLPNVQEALLRTAERFRTGRVEEANRLYADVLDALGVLVFSLEAAARELGDDAPELATVESESAPWVESLLCAQQRSDWVTVADCLEYEVATGLGQWCARIRNVEGRVLPAQEEGRDVVA